MRNVPLLCRTATTFSKSKSLDEAAFGHFLQRLVDVKSGVYLAAGGAGEGHALSRQELSRVYSVGVDVCKGRVPVNANLPEQTTAQATLEHAMLAIEAGIEIVQIYGPAGWHGYKPTDAEFIAYFDAVLKVIKHPVALASNPVLGYMQKANLIADICNRYSQVVAVNLSGVRDRYLIDLKDALKRNVDIYVALGGSLHALSLGASGLLGAEANIIPKTVRRYAELYASGDNAALANTYADIQRFSRHVEKWHGSTPRWIKMAMYVLGLPGGEGGARGPYLMPADDEMQKFTEGLLDLRIPEIDELAKAAGLRLPA